MSGKYNRNEERVYKLLDSEKSDIIFYYDESLNITNDIYCVVVKRGLSKENALIEADRILKLGGFRDITIKSIEKGRLDYNEYEGYWTFDEGGDCKSEVVWIILTR